MRLKQELEHSYCLTSDLLLRVHWTTESARRTICSTLDRRIPRRLMLSMMNYGSSQHAEPWGSGNLVVREARIEGSSLSEFSAGG